MKCRTPPYPRAARAARDARGARKKNAQEEDDLGLDYEPISTLAGRLGI